MNYKTHLYRLTFPNGKVYIGVTDNPEKRWASKYEGSECGRAIKEIGWENVKKEIIVKLPPSFENDRIILSLEREFIKLYGENSYNRTVLPEFYEQRVELRHNTGTYRPRKYWEIGGISKPAVEWCNDYKISMSQVNNRMFYQGLSLIQALTFPRVPSGRTRDPLSFWAECGCFKERKGTTV